MDGLVLPLLAASKNLKLFCFGEKIKGLKRKMMLHEHEMNNADSFRAARVTRQKN